MSWCPPTDRVFPPLARVFYLYQDFIFSMSMNNTRVQGACVIVTFEFPDGRSFPHDGDTTEPPRRGDAVLAGLRTHSHARTRAQGAGWRDRRKDGLEREPDAPCAHSGGH